MKRAPITSASPHRPCIPWSPCRLSLAFMNTSKPERTTRLEGELAGVRKQMAGYLKELGV